MKNHLMKLDQDLEFLLYRKYLKKIDKDNSLTARCELVRHLLVVAPNKNKQIKEKHVKNITSKSIFFPFIIVFISFIIFFSVGVYAFLGSPFIPSSPFTLLFMRNSLSFNTAEKLVYTEVMTIRNPKNGYFTDILADLYLGEERFLEASQNAWKAIVLQGETSYRLLRYALANIGHNGGLINDKTETILRRLIVLDPQNIDAQILLAKGMIQKGREDEAIRQLESFLETAPIMAKWKREMEKVIQKIKQKFLEKTIKSNNFISKK